MQNNLKKYKHVQLINLFSLFNFSNLFSYTHINKIKEMTPDTKRTLFLFIGSAFVSVATVIISFGLYAGRDENKMIDAKLQQKVDKEEYQEACKRTDERLIKIENTYDLLLEIRDNQAAQKTDIEWIKKTLDKKQK